MDKAHNLKEIISVIGMVIDIDNMVLTLETKTSDIKSWDSLTQVQIIVALEKHFNIRFNSKEIKNWTSINDIVKSIEDNITTTTEVGSDDYFIKGDNDIFFTPEIKTMESKESEGIPTYKQNFIKKFPNLIYGNNCFVGEGVTLTNVRIGDQVWINKFATIYSNYSEVKIGSNSYVGPYVWIEGHAGIEMGDFVHIGGPGTSLYTHSGMKIALNSEVLGNPGYKPQNQKSHYFRVPIRIGNNVWIGPNCSISPGTIINDFVVVMPNTLVKSGIVESFSLVQGNGIIEKDSAFVHSLFDK